MKVLFTLALCLAAAPALARENYALLIGANQYPSLEERWWLKGPANDVQLVAEYLLSRLVAVDSVDEDGWQPLHCAAHWRQVCKARSHYLEIV